MKYLTKLEKGVKLLDIKNIEKSDLIWNCFLILFENKELELLKSEALKVLKNFLKHTKSERLEERILHTLPDFIRVNFNLYKVVVELVNLADVFASKGDE